MMKKAAPKQRIEKCCKEIVQEIEHWKQINQHGCSDPSWPDGTNMNLTRNHKFSGGEMKRILDACCGSRMFYFDKNNPDVLYADNRELETTLCDGRQLLIKPDIQMDFRDMPYEDETFKVVVFDPPHLVHAGTGSWLAKKYGVLPEDWPEYLKQGFDECMRVLEPDGLLIFKWNEDQIPLSKVLQEFDQKPLLGDQRGKTRWLVFIK